MITRNKTRGREEKNQVKSAPSQRGNNEFEWREVSQKSTSRKQSDVSVRPQEGRVTAPVCWNK